MKISCPKCKTGLKIQDEKIPPQGIGARCPKCGHRIFVRKKTDSGGEKHKAVPGPETKTASRKRNKKPAGKTPADVKSVNVKPVNIKKVRAVPEKKKITGGNLSAPNEKASPEEPESPPFQAPESVVCPSCGQRQPPRQICFQCKSNLGDNPDSTRSKKSFLKSSGNAVSQYKLDTSGMKESFKKNLPNLVISFVADHMKTFAIGLVLVLILSFFIGKTPLGAVLFGADREIMYTKITGRLHTKLRQLNGAVLDLKIGNTGEQANDKITVSISGIGHSVDQLYYKIQNLDPFEPRSFDPVVTVSCEDGYGEKVPFYSIGQWGTANIHEILPKMLLTMEFMDPCFYFPDDFVDDKSDPVGLPLNMREEIILQIENLDAGTLLHLGFTTYSRDPTKKLGKKDLENIRLDIQTDASLLEGDPQSTTLAKVFLAIMDLF